MSMSNYSKFLINFLMIFLLGTSTTVVYGKDNPIERTAIDFTQVAKKCIPAVVSIKVKSIRQQSNDPNPFDKENGINDFFNEDFFQRFFFGRGQDQEKAQKPIVAQASGFIISSNGTILTNSHVVKDTSEILVTLNDGREFAAKLLGLDSSTDIAVIKIEAKDLPFLELADSDSLQIGQWAIAIGTPMGLRASLTVGVVSATGRNNLDVARIEDFIQTDAAINSGNSGGPLLNFDGQVIGMNTAIFTNMSNGGYMGIGFAIPSNFLKHIMNEIITTGKVSRGYIGVVLQEIDNDLAKAFNLEKTEGALVAEVAANSPAEAAGIKQGDIVVKYDKHSVNSIATLRNAIALMSPNTKITLTILRDGKSLEIPVTISLFPSDEVKVKGVEAKENKYGFSVKDMTPDIAKTYGHEVENGVVISKLSPNGPAAIAGLKAGTLIIAVNQKKVSTVSEFNKALEATPTNKPLLLLVKQGDAVRFISLQTE